MRRSIAIVASLCFALQASAQSAPEPMPISAAKSATVRTRRVPKVTVASIKASLKTFIDQEIAAATFNDEDSFFYFIDNFTDRASMLGKQLNPRLVFEDAAAAIPIPQAAVVAPSSAVPAISTPAIPAPQQYPCPAVMAVNLNCPAGKHQTSDPDPSNRCGMRQICVDNEVSGYPASDMCAKNPQWMQKIWSNRTQSCILAKYRTDAAYKAYIDGQDAKLNGAGCAWRNGGDASQSETFGVCFPSGQGNSQAAGGVSAGGFTLAGYRNGLFANEAWKACMDSAGSSADALLIRKDLADGHEPGWSRLSQKGQSDTAACERPFVSGMNGGATMPSCGANQSWNGAACVSSPMSGGTGMSGWTSYAWVDSSASSPISSMIASSVTEAEKAAGKAVVSSCRAQYGSLVTMNLSWNERGIPTGCSAVSVSGNGGMPIGICHGAPMYAGGTCNESSGGSSTDCPNIQSADACGAANCTWSGSVCGYRGSAALSPQNCGGGSYWNGSMCVPSGSGYQQPSGGIMAFTAPRRACMVAALKAAGAPNPDQIVSDMESMMMSPGIALDAARMQAMGQYGSQVSSCSSVAEAPRASLFGSVIDTLHGWFSRP